jgi:hypothetical protein
MATRPCRTVTYIAAASLASARRQVDENCNLDVPTVFEACRQAESGEDRLFRIEKHTTKEVKWVVWRRGPIPDKARVTFNAWLPRHVPAHGTGHPGPGVDFDKIEKYDALQIVPIVEIAEPVTTTAINELK